MLRLSEAYLTPNSVTSAEMLAEELAALAFDAPYDWRGTDLTAELQLPTGLNLLLSGNESERTVKLDVTWEQEHQAKYESVKK